MHRHQGLHVTGQVQRAGQGDDPAVQVDAVERRGQLLAVLVLHMGIRQPLAGGVELLPRRDPHREGAALGAMHHHDVALADERHPPVRRQPHRIQPDEIRIQRQVAEHHAVKADGVGHHADRAPDLAILPHQFGVVPGLCLVAGGRDLAAKAHRDDAGLVVHPPVHIEGGKVAVAVGRGLDAAAAGGVGADVEAAGCQRGARRPERHRIH
ncbi:hypothetical protein D3C71_805750 [compost metagenome]